MRYIVDIDGTICTYEKGVPYKDANPLKGRIKFFNDLYELGHTIVYWTARGTVTGLDWYDLTGQQLKEWGAKHHSYKVGKPAYDVLICDKAFNTETFFKN